MSAHPLINQEAPSAITLKIQRGEDMDLECIIGQGNPIVLFFYPRYIKATELYRMPFLND